MGSLIDDNAGRNTNCIKQSNRSYENLEFRQYDENENIIYYYRKQNNFSSDHAFFVYDKNEKIIGYIAKIFNPIERYEFYDENKKIKFYIEKTVNCCEADKYTFFGIDKNIESIIKIKFSCGVHTIEEYNKYESRTNTAIMKADCCGADTCNEIDVEGNIIFIIKKFSDCGTGIIKIYDNNRNEVNLKDKNIFNEGFTKIQIILILILFYYDQEPLYKA